ncbi:MAG TPA: metalloregulator ArsR/SmtB family transcription factor [Kofleriaceae bacterium]|nr:metalloregulator ArsR/SmtB family transcription factor [Kofleriaceae bacterium]
MTQLDAMLAALADPHRRGVVDLLRHQPRRAGDLADELGMSRPAMSRHLKVLRRTGLIEPASDEADARARVYRLLPEPFSALRRWLDDVEQFWSHELDAFRAHAEATRGARASAPAAETPARPAGRAMRIAAPRRGRSARRAQG